MPRISTRLPPGAPNTESSPPADGVVAVDRALLLLRAFQPGEPSLSLADLAERTQQYKSTVLRLLASLQRFGLVQRDSQGRYRLGPEVARLARLYTGSFSLEPVILPVLHELVARTRESAAFHVRQGDQRLCLYRVDSPQPIRDHIRVGDLLPLDRGAGGRVLGAFSGATGALYDRVRRDRVVALTGDREDGVAGVSAPVFGAGGQLEGALTLTLPAQRLQPAFTATVRDAAKRLTESLGGPFEPG
ncbi:IclR family transcriptional regulator [Piscinibacter sp.]|uniref:IclR family transcriptional regulator n=1 Tax=Piscinibacter sp. TaxID=1903157 RepID=UPI002C6733EE|nr:IclR family transcriptional regulator [Albitalea sp.]HUG24429.1 IclR family transcriptional regulator [Albitalea sp.]